MKKHFKKSHFLSLNLIFPCLKKNISKKSRFFFLPSFTWTFRTSGTSIHRHFTSKLLANSSGDQLVGTKKEKRFSCAFLFSFFVLLCRFLENLTKLFLSRTCGFPSGTPSLISFALTLLGMCKKFKFFLSHFQKSDKVDAITSICRKIKNSIKFEPLLSFRKNLKTKLPIDPMVNLRQFTSRSFRKILCR